MPLARSRAAQAFPNRSLGTPKRWKWRPGGQERGVRPAARKRAVALAGHWAEAAFPSLAKSAGPEVFAEDLDGRAARPHR
jgi:hypothetical protein